MPEIKAKGIQIEQDSFFEMVKDRKVSYLYVLDGGGKVHVLQNACSPIGYATIMAGVELDQFRDSQLMAYTDESAKLINLDIVELVAPYQNLDRALEFISSTING